MQPPAANPNSAPEVTEAGDRMCYWVRSRSNPKIRHRVDLTANGGGGECSCKDWQTRRGPALRVGGETLTRQTTCWHLRQALTHFCRGLLTAMAQSETNQRTNASAKLPSAAADRLNARLRSGGAQ